MRQKFRARFETGHHHRDGTGTVTKARVKVSLDKIYGLDQSALETAKQWTFTPGTLKGELCLCIPVLKLEFRLHWTGRVHGSRFTFTVRCFGSGSAVVGARCRTTNPNGEP
jgi:hypothetical protein